MACTIALAVSQPGLADRVRKCRVAHPRLRNGLYFPFFLEHRRSDEKTLTAVIREAYV